MSYLKEEWKPVVNYEGLYEVSNLGVIRRVGGRCLAASANSTGYLTVSLCRDQTPKTRKVHSVVCEAFLGPRPVGYHINHIDTDKRNPALANLEYVPPRLNHLLAQHKRFENDAALGVRPERFGRKLKEADVIRIRELAATMGSRRIGVMFGLNHQTVRQIIKRELWKHVK